MNARIFKKKSKQAMKRLIEEHGFDPMEFETVDGTEEIEGVTRRRARRIFGRSRLPLKGTPVYVAWDYWNNEVSFESSTPAMLRHMEWQDSHDWEAEHYRSMANRFGVTSVEAAKAIEDVVVAFSNLKAEVDDVAAAFNEFGGSLTPELLREFEDARDRVDSWERA